MSKLFVDANIIAEILFQRTKHQTARARLEQAGTWLFISALTVHILYYLAERDHLDPQITRAALEPFLIVPIDQRVVELAQARFSGRDFEDCLQAAAAELAGCTQIITLDQRFAEVSGAILPIEVLA